jgi:hypothetical protein
VIDDDHDLSTWGNKAQTWSQNGTNAQRVYLHRVDTRQLTYAMPVSGASSPAVGSISAGAYKIMHYTADGHVLCLDADGTGGAAPGAGARVGWYGCDPNAVNQPNQLWAFGPVAGRPDDQWETQPALVNLGSLPDPQNMDIRNAPILTAAANAAGTSSPLSLQAQANATAANSSWILGNADPGATDGCNYFDC